MTAIRVISRNSKLAIFVSITNALTMTCCRLISGITYVFEERGHLSGFPDKALFCFRRSFLIKFGFDLCCTHARIYGSFRLVSGRKCDEFSKLRDVNNKLHL